MTELWINQTVLPDYRVPVFRGIRERLGERFFLSCGDRSYGNAIRNVREDGLVDLELTNRFSLGQRVLWQSGLLGRWQQTGVALLEFNLRAISTWRLIAKRANAGLPIGYWGHISGRARRGLPVLVRNWMLRRASVFVCYTESQAAMLRCERPALRVLVAPNAVMSAADCWSGSLPASGVRDVIFVGRLIREKKPELGLRGFAEARQRGMVPLESRLVFVGEGPEREALEAMAKKCGIPCVFAGHVSDVKQLRALYSSALFSLSPGYVGLSATQSLAFGVPIAVAEGEPHSPEIETCRAGETAMFFAKDSPEALAERMGEFFASRDHWMARRAKISAKIASAYSFERMVDALVDAAGISAVGSQCDRVACNGDPKI